MRNLTSLPCSIRAKRAIRRRGGNDAAFFRCVRVWIDALCRRQLSLSLTKNSRCWEGSRGIGLLSLFLALLAASPAIAQTTYPYTVTDLGALGGTYSQAEHINAAGQVVGFSNTLGDTESHALTGRTE